MAKRRKSSRKSSSKCPEPLNTMIDIAGGLAMGAIASKMEKKYHYRAKGKINPYAASAMGIATGRIRGTNDILRMGAYLGAAGSFDVRADKPRATVRPTSGDRAIYEIRPPARQNNRYAWRLNCEDGSAYGVDPNVYETRDAYNRAIQAARGGKTAEKKDVKAVNEAASQQDTEQARTNYNLICRVSRLDSGENLFYFASESTIRPGDKVRVSGEDGKVAEAIILSVEKWDGKASASGCIVGFAGNE